MTFNVVAVSMSPKAYTNANGTFQPYTLFGSFDGGEPEYVVIHAKSPVGKVPHQGEAIECTADSVPVDVQVKDKIMEIKRIRRVSQQGGGQSPAPRSQSPSVPAHNAQFEAPDRQASIERQNSLTNAVALCVARSEVSVAAKQYDEAAAQLTEENVVSVAAGLARYNSGKPEKPAPEKDEDIAMGMGFNGHLASIEDDPGPQSPF